MREDVANQLPRITANQQELQKHHNYRIRGFRWANTSFSCCIYSLILAWDMKLHRQKEATEIENRSMKTERACGNQQSHPNGINRKPTNLFWKHGSILCNCYKSWLFVVLIFRNWRISNQLFIRMSKGIGWTLFSWKQFLIEINSDLSTVNVHVLDYYTYFSTSKTDIHKNL